MFTNTFFQETKRSKRFTGVQCQSAWFYDQFQKCWINSNSGIFDKKMFRLYGMSIVILKCLTQVTSMHDKILRERKNYNLLLRNGLKELTCFILEILIILFSNVLC